MYFRWIFLILVITSCIPEVKNKEPIFFEVKKDIFNKYINDIPLPKEPNLNSDKHLFNNDYPIEISLYNDGKWFYHLENLGSGTGTYKFKDGKIHLFAERKIFNINIDIKSLDENGENIVVEFFDRFGHKQLKMDKSNY